MKSNVRRAVRALRRKREKEHFERDAARAYYGCGEDPDRDGGTDVPGGRGLARKGKRKQVDGESVPLFVRYVIPASG